MVALCRQECPFWNPSSKPREHSQSFVRAEPKIDEFLIAGLSLCALCQEPSRKQGLTLRLPEHRLEMKTLFAERRAGAGGVIIAVSVGRMARNPLKELWLFIISFWPLVLLLFPPSFPKT